MSSFDKISLDNPNNEKLLEQQFYQDYLRKKNSTNTNEKNKYLKIFLTNKSYILALKQLSILERTIFYLSIIKHKKLDYISNYLKISKNEISKIKQNAINHFIENLKNKTDKENE